MDRRVHSEPSNEELGISPVTGGALLAVWAGLLLLDLALLAVLVWALRAALR